MASITLENVTKTFDRRTTAVSHLTLEVRAGEFMVLVGPSGCGKTTILRLIAGLETPTSGTIRIGDRTINGVPPRDRDVAMVFQDGILYPHLSVYDNLAFPLRMRGQSRDQVQRCVGEVIEMLGLGDLLHRKPAALSGGQRQRVALGRAMVREPAAFLFDEPLSSLDVPLRGRCVKRSRPCTRDWARRRCTSRTTSRRRWPWASVSACCGRDKSSRWVFRRRSTTGRPTASSPVSWARRQ